MDESGSTLSNMTVSKSQSFARDFVRWPMFLAVLCTALAACDSTLDQSEHERLDVQGEALHAKVRLELRAFHEVALAAMLDAGAAPGTQRSTFCGDFLLYGDDLNPLLVAYRLIGELEDVSLSVNGRAREPLCEPVILQRAARVLPADFLELWLLLAVANNDSQMIEWTSSSELLESLSREDERVLVYAVYMGSCDIVRMLNAVYSDSEVAVRAYADSKCHIRV